MRRDRGEFLLRAVETGGRAYPGRRGRKALPDDQRLVQLTVMLPPADYGEITRLFPGKARAEWSRRVMQEALAGELHRWEDEARAAGDQDEE